MYWSRWTLLNKNLGYESTSVTQMFVRILCNSSCSEYNHWHDVENHDAIYCSTNITSCVYHKQNDADSCKRLHVAAYSPHCCRCCFCFWRSSRLLLCANGLWGLDTTDHRQPPPPPIYIYVYIFLIGVNTRRTSAQQRAVVVTIVGSVLCVVLCAPFSGD